MFPEIIRQDGIGIIHLIQHPLRRFLFKDQLQIRMRAQTAEKVEPAISSRRVQDTVPFPEITALVEADAEQDGRVEGADEVDV